MVLAYKIKATAHCSLQSALKLREMIEDSKYPNHCMYPTVRSVTAKEIDIVTTNPFSDFFLEILVVDTDEEVNQKEIKQWLEPNDHLSWHSKLNISLEVTSIQEKEIEWSDDHPLNNVDTWREYFDKLFK
jgi:hypothetical protein